jgi:phosphoribosylformylglycinamidine cyclo-ligase
MSDLYKKAGVNIEEGTRAVNLIKEKVKETFDHRVLSGIGSFGAMFDARFLQAYRHPILVQSIDGVGTKIKVAQMAGQFESLGEDIVNHCCDDILCQGARGITFLDYLAFDRLSPEVMASMVSGMAKACKEAGIALIGGETAEMPGVYLPGESDIAGCITGVVERDSIITGEKIRPGDVLLGLPSSGLHTNGFSLARKVLFDKAGLRVDSYFEELGCSLGEALLRPHRNYAPAVLPLLEKFDVLGIAHLTGGGFYDNIPRVLPAGTAVEIYQNSWPVLPIFSMIQKLGSISFEEMHHVFNMGIGLVLVVKENQAEAVKSALSESGQDSYLIGRVIEGKREVSFSVG